MAGLPRSCSGRNIETTAKEMKLAEGSSNDDKQLVFPFMIGARAPGGNSDNGRNRGAWSFEMRSKGYIQSDIAASISAKWDCVSEVLRGLR